MTRVRVPTEVQRERKNERERRRYAAMSIEQRRALAARKQRSPAPKKQPKGIAIPPSRALERAVRPVVVRESVEAWMRRTGQQPEVLPGFTGTRPWRPVNIPRSVAA